MLKNRIIMTAVIVAAFVFASFYGGSASYAILYMTITLPIVSFFYLIYFYLHCNAFIKLCISCYYESISFKDMFNGKD